MNTILPIGSVVKVRNLKKLMMIFGFLQSHGAQPDVCFDYVGVPYPEGNIDLRAHFGFQRSDIEQVLFEGYRTEDFEGIEKLFEIKDAYEQQKLKKKEAEK